MEECNNVAYLRGSTKDIDELYKIFSNPKFSMGDIIPIHAITDEIRTNLRNILWGSTEDMDVIRVVRIKDNMLGVYSITDIPNIRFWSVISTKFDIGIDYTYLSESEEYVGKHRFINGELYDEEYYEPDNPHYRKFYSKVFAEQSLITDMKVNKISIKDILKKEGN